MFVILKSICPGDSWLMVLMLIMTLPVTCLDPRCVPEQFFGPDFRTATIRNAGGRASQDAITSITVLRSLMMDAVAVFVIHHTGTHIFYPPGSEHQSTEYRDHVR